MTRTQSLALAVASFALLTGPAAQAAPRPVAPAATPFTLGALKLYALRDAQNVVPNDNRIFGIGQTPDAVAQLLRAAGAPTDTIALAVDALLVKMPGHVVLLDTGLGPRVGGMLMQSLAKADVTPDKVTDILITHSHGDHIGGLLNADGTSAFPGATIRLSQAEWDWMQSRPSNAAFVKTLASQVKPFTPGVPILPGITPVAIAGHTPGHVGYQIASNGRRLLDIGDTAHSSIISLARPDWSIAFDTDKEQGEASREGLLAQLAKSQEPIFAPHFPYPGIGHVVATGHGHYAFVAGLK